MDMTDHVLYLGKMVPKASFRAFVHNAKGEEKLANSWAEYQQLLDSCVWFAQKQDADAKAKDLKKPVKQKRSKACH